jgi:integrase
MGVKVRWVPAKKKFYLFINDKGRRKAIPAGTDKRKAGLAARDAESQLLRGKLSMDAEVVSPTLTVYFETWLDTRARQRCKSRTIAIYTAVFNCYIKPILGSKLVSALTDDHVKDLLAHWSKDGRRSATLKLIMRVLSSALKDAKKYLPVNPTNGLIEYCKQPDEIKFTIDPLSEDESSLLLTTARVATPREYPLFVTAIRTGLRIGELLALEWGDVDLHGHFLTVRRTVDDETGLVTAPKNGKTRRVDLSDQTTQVLQDLLVARKAEKLAHGWKELPTLVFVRPTGEKYQCVMVREQSLYRALAKANLRKIRFHDLRHTFASELLRRGAPITYVKEQLGHGSIQITVDTYGHLMPGANRAWVNQLDETTAKGATA